MQVITGMRELWSHTGNCSWPFLPSLYKWHAHPYFSRNLPQTFRWWCKSLPENQKAHWPRHATSSMTLTDWEQSWKMIFNRSKCEAMHISRSILSIDNLCQINRYHQCQMTCHYILLDTSEVVPPTVYVLQAVLTTPINCQFSFNNDRVPIQDVFVGITSTVSQPHGHLARSVAKWGRLQ